MSERRSGFVPEIEQNLLGTMLKGGDQRAVLARLEPQHFIEPVHGVIFETMQITHERTGTTTLPVVAATFPAEAAKQFKADTGMTIPAYLAKLVSDATYEAAGGRTAAQAVVRQWARLSVAREASLAASAADDPATDPMHLARAISASLDEITSHLRRGQRGKTRRSMQEAANLALADARAARARKGLVGITTGLIDLDRAMGGFQRKDLIIVAARPAMGKTTLATSISTAAARSGVGVGMFSLEMDAAKLGARYASDIALAAGDRIPYQDIIAGRIDDDQDAAIERALADYSGLPFLVEDASGLTMPEIRAKTEAMLADAEEAGTPLGMLMVDHLTKIRPSQRYAGNRSNEVGEVTDGLKEIAREYDLAVVLLSQLNRGVESRDEKRPQLMDLRESGNIEQDADAVLFLYRESYYLEQKRPDGLDKRLEWEADLSACRNKGELAIGKQRNGPTSTIDLYMDVACSAVRNAARGY